MTGRKAAGGNAIRLAEALTRTPFHELRAAPTPVTGPIETWKSKKARGRARPQKLGAVRKFLWDHPRGWGYYYNCGLL